VRNFFIGNKKDKKKETMSNEGEYEALEKSVRYIPWKGKKEEWYTWHKTFLVRAMICGYHGVLVGLEEVPTDDKAKVLASTALTNLTSDQKHQYNNYKMNTRAYADLLQCCIQDIVSFGIIDTAKDKNLANGNLALAWKRLSEKFAGRNNAEKMKLIKQFKESHMKKKKNLMYGLRTWNVYNRELQNAVRKLRMMN